MKRGEQLTMSDRIELADKAEAARNATLTDVIHHQGRPYTELEILDFEEKWGPFTEPKTQAIWEEFGVNDRTYHQRLNRIINNPAALAARPQLVYRLRAVRDDISKARAARVFRRAGSPSGIAKGTA